MIEIIKKTNCIGCYACYTVCPKKCITMKIDREGFFYPEIDSSMCIDCKLCQKVCPIINPRENKNKSEEQCSYAA